MCGIAGIISLNNNQVNYDAITKMTDKISHRGPDGEGFLATNAPDFCSSLKTKRPGALVVSKTHRQQLVFGHRRLAIIDLNENASQPMTDASERYWIVYNGEIYNHADLRKELVSFGYKFKTDHSDTEVILNAYDKWGPDCLVKFNGMWSFCIWDTEKNTFFIARDKEGKKPFYYCIHNNRFYFASELKAIVVNSEIPKELNEKAIYDYLTYSMTPSPATIFKNIYKLPAAHYMFFEAGQEIRTTHYWSPLNTDKSSSLGFDELKQQLRDKIRESVQFRFIADVEIGILLSGGLDSSINLACINKQTSKKVKAFSVGFENDSSYKNELPYSESAAKLFNVDYHPLLLSDQEFMDFMPRMVYFQDEPTADTANIPIYFISKLARSQGVKVLLGGEGSDEIFIGYKLWKIAKQFSDLVGNRPALAGLLSGLHKNSPLKNKRVYYHGWYDKVISGKPVFWSGTELRTEKEKQAALSPEFLQKLGNYQSFEPFQNLYNSFTAAKGLDFYEWASASDVLFRLPDFLLARFDRMTMAASVEGRNPFLDTGLIELAMKIPARYKTTSKHEKYILKKSFEGILPDEIIYRKKDSFSVPLQRFYNNREFKAMCLDAIEKFNADYPVFSDDYLQKLKSGTGDMSNELWNASNLALWYQEFK